MYVCMYVCMYVRTYVRTYLPKNVLYVDITCAVCIVCVLSGFNAL